MNIHLTKKEYRALLDIFYIADWVMCSRETSPQSKYPDHQALRKKILSYYKEMDAENLIEHERSADEYYELSSFEDLTQEKFIKPYDEEVFWDELLERLAIQDVISQHGVSTIENMDGIERATLIDSARSDYEDIFASQGIDAIAVTKRVKH